MSSSAELFGPGSPLANAVSGEVLLPGDDGFDRSRAVYNTRFESRPDVIVRCADTEDVVHAVNCARENALRLTVKSGGHDYSGNSASPGGILIDLAPMNAVRVDPEARIATVGPGAKWGDFDQAAQVHGLATSGGTVSKVGVAGVTLGGGTGFLARKHGIVADNLVGAEVVTAQGAVVRASSTENHELLWGLQGGGGNLGVVTSFEFRLHEVGPEVLAGQIIYPFDLAADGLRLYRDFMAQAPDELACYAFFFRIPPVEPFPEGVHGQIAFDFVLSYAGPPGDGEAVIAPLRSLGEPILEFVTPQSYLELQQSFDANSPEGQRWYSKAHHMDSMSDEAIDTTLRHVEDLPGAFSSVYFEPQGGAVNRVDVTATAYPHRTAAFQMHIFPGWADPMDDEGCISWARAFSEAMAPHANGGVYVNLMGEDEADRVPAAYGSNYTRLQALKAHWDPTNLFRGNHNIEPNG